jgi:hypothetical protein
MGHGGYSIGSTNTFTSSARGYAGKTNFDIFTERNINAAMNPLNVALRESRDSADHPNSYPVVLGLDVTGSMGAVPNFLIKEGFNAIMETIIKGGELDPQILFMGIGDHECDDAPFQIGQFESNDELLHNWFTKVYLEGGGGGNAGESYLLAWYFAAFRTATDSFEKRGRKGILFTVGDEPVLNYLGKEALFNIFGTGQYSNYTAKQLLEQAQQNYDVYHIHVAETSTGQRAGTVDGWIKLMGKNVLVVQNSKDVASVIASTILEHKQVQQIGATSTLLLE